MGERGVRIAEVGGSNPPISTILEAGYRDRQEVSRMAGQPGEAKKRKGLSGLVLVGCLFIGMGVGFLTQNVPVGLFIGLGVGFIAMAIVRYRLGEW